MDKPQSPTDIAASNQPSDTAQNHGIPWTSSDIEQLREAYRQGTNRNEIARLLGRTRNSVEYKAARLKIERSNPRQTRPWTTAEHAILNDMHLSSTADEIASILGRSIISVESKRLELNYRKRSARLTWSQAEDEFLTSLYATHDNVAIARIIGRTPKAVHQRISVLGLAKIVWEKLHGPVPADHLVMIVNAHLPRTVGNMRLVRKGELWTVVTGSLLPPEARELLAIRRQIEKESKKLKAN